MTWQAIAASAMLMVGVAIELFCCLGVLLMGNAYDRLHFTAPATVLGPVCIAAAVVLQEALSTAGIKAILVAAVLLAGGPVLSHAVGRAARIREHGQWEPQPGENIEEV